MFEYIRRLIALRRELQPLQTGKLTNLYVSEQQYAYARGDVIIVINNDAQQSEFSFGTDQREGIFFHDRLGGDRDVIVNEGKIRVSLPARSAAIFVRKDQ